MCIVSMVGDEYSKTWPSPTIVPTIIPNILGNGVWTPIREATALELFEQISDLARRLDAALGLPDCENPEKRAWLEDVRARVRAHELAKVDERLDAPGR